MYIPSLVFKSARNRIAKYCHHPLSCSKFTTAFRSSKWEILLWSSASCAVTAYHEHFCQPIRKIVESNWTIFPKMGQKNVSQTTTEISTHISFSFSRTPTSCAARCSAWNIFHKRLNLKKLFPMNIFSSSLVIPRISLKRWHHLQISPT